MAEEKNVQSWWRTHRPTTRRLAQLYAALLYNANVKGFITGKIYTGSSKALCVPGLNCYSCPGAVGACPLGALQNALAASGHAAGWYVFGIILLFGVTLGRTICGWLCPVGLMQELLHKIPTPKIKKGKITRALSHLKYVILAVFVIALPLVYALRYDIPLPAFCKYICPAGTLEGAIALLSHPDNSGMFAQLGVLFTRKYIILLLLGLLSVFMFRPFCRFLCPLGAIYSLFNRFSLVGMTVDAHKCNHCGACVRHCGMDVACVGDRECISCGQCMGHCHQQAISITCGKRVVKPASGASVPAKKRGRAIWAVLIAALAAAIVWFNVLDTRETPAQAALSDAPVGHEVGQRLSDFTVTLMDGSEFALSDQLGKVVIINQWATYCTPCVAELPFFEQLQEEHPDIVVLAFHQWLTANPTPADFIDSQGWGAWSLRFCVDEDQSLLNAIGADNVMPRTVVLNPQGEVVYNEQRSVTYDMLESLLALAESH